ncbi:MAG: aspartate aminotransferase family protein [Eubacteriales bacterium]|nr:aspartate aminotransferase family protein [Eubacteriales bacterium]
MIQETRRADGIYITDENGKRYTTLNEIASCLGYQNKKFLEKLHVCLDNCMIGHVPGVGKEKKRLLQRLLDEANGDFNKAYLMGIGGEAVDYAVKIARRATGKEEIISFWHALHGRSYAGASLSGVALRKSGFGNPMPGIIMVPYPSEEAEQFAETEGVLGPFAFLEKQLQYASAGSLAAIIIEPIQALGGMVSPSKEAMQDLRKLCDEKGALLIFDEIQCGSGRCGSMYSYQQFGVVPDIVLLGKGLSNGMGYGAMLLNERASCGVIEAALKGGCSDNEFACGVTNVVLDIYQEEKVFENVKKQGNLFQTQLYQGLSKNPIVKQISGRGLGIGIGLEAGYAEIVQQQLFEKGILIGVSEDYLLIRPPYIIREEETMYCADIIIQTLNEVYQIQNAETKEKKYDLNQRRPVLIPETTYASNEMMREDISKTRRKVTI